MEKSKRIKIKKAVNLYKPMGLTPLQAVKIFKKRKTLYKHCKASYPGRLDPLAQGVLILLINEENKKIKKYLKLDKEYRAQILFGFSSDTHDILGIAEKASKIPSPEEIKKQIKTFKGKQEQKLPAYSSYKIKGKPLFYYARKKRLKDIKIPKKQVEIKKIKINSASKINGRKLLKEIVRKINLVEGDFRQEEIKMRWRKLLNENKSKYIIIEINVACSSGTYIRALAHELGEKTKSKALLLNLIRTKVGKFEIEDSIKIKYP